MTNTAHFGFKEIGPSDSIADENYKFGTTDRESMDTELYKAATHHHTGSTTAVTAPTNAPTLTLGSTAGSLLAGTRYYYKHTWVNASGIESQASTESYIDTAAAITSPAAPTLSTSPTGGTLASGTYFYALTAYEPDSTHETLALNAASIATAVGSTNKNTITFPTLPTGAHGYNIYRRAPGGVGYLFLTAVSMNVATPPSNYVDTGAVLANCDRSVPSVNSTRLDQSIQVCVGGATPTIPAGYLWRIYRTATAGNYSNALLTTVASSSLCFTDIGAGTTSGGPPTQNSLAAPDKVLLTDSTEVQGRLPMGDATYPFVLTFEFTGVVVPNVASALWICEYPAATIIGVRVVAARGQTTTGVGAQLYKGTGATPTYTAMFSSNAPSLQSGWQTGSRFTPTTKSLVVGDSMYADITNISGATPIASNLTVFVYGIAHGFSTTTSFVDGTTTGA